MVQSPLYTIYTSMRGFPRQSLCQLHVLGNGRNVVEWFWNVGGTCSEQVGNVAGMVKEPSGTFGNLVQVTLN